MWPLWLIITVAVGGAVSLTVTAVLTVVHYERKRHRRLMAQHQLDRNTSQINRYHLSATDVDISSLPRPAKSLRSSYQRPRSDSIRFYATIPSQDEIRTFPEGTLTEVVIDQPHIQPAPDRLHQWLSPSKSKKLRRKKKIAKLSIGAPVARSPMSAITEATEHSRVGSPEPVELAAQTTPKMTPDRILERHIPVQGRAVQTASISIGSVLEAPTEVERRISHRISCAQAVKSRSISTGNIKLPPNIPLPPIPTTDSQRNQCSTSLSRSKSDISLCQRKVSELSAPSSPISRGTRGEQSNDFSGFKLGLLNESTSVRRSRNEATHVKNYVEKCDTNDAPFSNLTLQQDRDNPDPEDSFKTIDASSWNLPKSLRTPRSIMPTMSANNSEMGSRAVSMIDYDAILSAGSSLNNSPTKPYDGPLSRPVSAMSVSSVDMFRLSVVGNKPSDSPRIRGHKRQNCVRIKNLTPVDSKKRLSSQLGRLAEAEETNLSNPLPETTMTAQDPSTPTHDPSLTVPMRRQPQALSLRVKRPGWTSIKDKNKQADQPYSTIGLVKRDVEVIAEHSRPSMSSTVSPQDSDTRKMSSTEVTPTVLEAVKTSGTDVSVSPGSSNSQFSPVSPQRRRTQIQGPRNAPPPSLRVRNANRADSPLRRKSSDNDRINKQHLNLQRDRKASDADLRKSIAMLKSLTLPDTMHPQNMSSINVPTVNMVARTPSSRYADSPTIRVPKCRLRSNTVAGHAGEAAQRSSRQLPSPQLHRKHLLNVQTSTPPSHGKFTYSPSSISIWEDASVQGDSPEVPTRHISTSICTSTQRQTSAEKLLTDKRYSPVKSRRDHFDQLSTYARDISSQQQQQFGQQTQIQRESLWKLQQNADAITSRALARDNNEHSTTKSPQGKRLASPKAKLQDLYDSVPSGLGLRGSTQSTNSRDGRDRSHTFSAATRSGGRTACEGVGLGLKFGEKSMAYTINEVNKDGIGRLR